MPIRYLCIDDEPLARQGVKLALEPYKDFQLVAEFASAEEALESNLSDIDVVFLDIEMPRKNGFSILEEWQGHLPLIVFVTAYEHYAVKAFEQQAHDYILKPFDESRFTHVIRRIQVQLSQASQAVNTESLLKTVETLKKQIIKQSKNISVKTDEGYFRINVRDIIYMESVGNLVCIHLKDRQLITRQTLKYYIVELSEFDFFQVHKSFQVNAKHVEQVKKLRFGDYELTLSNRDKIRLSRRYKSSLYRLTEQD